MSDNAQNRQIRYEKGLFCGLISSKRFLREEWLIKGFLKELLLGNGAVIYEYNRKEYEPNEKKIQKYLGLDIKELEKEGKVIFICGEDEFFQGDEFMIDDAISIYQDSIDTAKKKGFKDILILNIRDGYFSGKVDINKLLLFHKKLKEIGKKNEIAIVTKYIIDGFEENDFIKFVTLHDKFILDSSGEDKIYTCKELAQNSLIELFNNYKQEEGFEEELKTLEILRTIGELYEGAIHDFNNVLTTIIGFSQIAQLKANDEVLKSYIDIIYQAALDGKAVVDKSKDFIRGTYSSSKGVHKLNELIQSSIDMISPRLKGDRKNKKIDIEVIKDLKSESYIYCNEHEIRRVLLNILFNALDSLEVGGKIFVRSYDKKEMAIVEIEDTGIGMDENTLKNIFKPFFTTKGESGTGIGLHVAKNILNEHSAKIYAESELGKGTKFIITFNENMSVQSNTIKEEEYSNYLEQKKVLVIDDNKNVANSIKELLEYLKFDVDIETCEEKILDKLDNNDFNFVICDFLMPKKDGIEVSREIKEKYPNMPFILMTGCSKDSLNTYIETVDYILKKPFTIDELSDAIMNISEAVKI